MNNIYSDKLRDFDIKLKLKPGVFSSKGVDIGTKLLVENMEVDNGTMVADIGCGAGVIGIIASKLNPSGHVHLFDEHLTAVEVAKANVELNGLRNVEVYLSDLFSAVSNRTYHLILSNPPQHLGNDFLEEEAKQCFLHLKPGGQVYWVVQKHVKPLIERLFEKVFRNYKIVAQGKEHVVLKCQKSNIKSQNKSDLVKTFTI